MENVPESETEVDVGVVSTVVRRVLRLVVTRVLPRGFRVFVVLVRCTVVSEIIVLLLSPFTQELRVRRCEIVVTSSSSSSCTSFPFEDFFFSALLRVRYPPSFLVFPRLVGDPRSSVRSTTKSDPYRPPFSLIGAAMVVFADCILVVVVVVVEAPARLRVQLRVAYGKSNSFGEVSNAILSFFFPGKKEQKRSCILYQQAF